MRYLIKTMDLDDALWLVLVVLAVGLYRSGGQVCELQKRVADLEKASRREHDPEPLELREVDDECGPTATEWGTGSIYSEPAGLWNLHMAGYPRMPVRY